MLRSSWWVVSECAKFTKRGARGATRRLGRAHTMPMLWSSPRSLGQGGNASLLSDEPGDTGMLRTPDGAVHYEDRSDYKREVSLPPSPVGAAVWISSRGDVAISRARCWDSIRGWSWASACGARPRPCSGLGLSWVYRTRTSVPCCACTSATRCNQRESTPPVLLQPFPNELMQVHFPVLIRGTQVPQAYFPCQWKIRARSRVRGVGWPRPEFRHNLFEIWVVSAVSEI